MTFPLTGVLDDFNRADGSAASKWISHVGGVIPVIASNRVPGQAGLTTDTAWNEVFTPDQEAYIDLVALGTNCDFWLDLRNQGPTATATNTGYEIAVTASTGLMSYYRIVANGYTSFDSFTPSAWAAGDTFGMEIMGSGTTVLMNTWRIRSGTKTLLRTTTDTNTLRTVAGGMIGWGVSGTDPASFIFDNWGGGSQPGATGATSSIKYPRPALRRRYS